MAPLNPLISLRPKQNLVKPISTEQIRTSGTFRKKLALDIFAVLSAFAVGYSYHLFLEGRWSLLPVVLSGLAFSVLSTLELFLTTPFKRRLFIIILQIVALLILFYQTPLYTLLLVTGFMFLLFLWGEFQARSLRNNMLRLRVFRVSRYQLHKVITALIFMMIILYLPQWDGTQIFLPERTFASIYGWGTGVAHSFYSEFDFSSSAQKLAESVLRLQVKDDPMFLRLPLAEQNKFIAERARELIAQISKNTGVPISPAENLHGALYRLIVSVLNEWHAQYGVWFVVGWAIAAFLIAQGIGVIVNWFAAGAAFLCIELLLAMDVLVIATESQVREMLDFP